MNINQVNTAGLQKDALNNTDASPVKSGRYNNAQKERIAKASKQFESLLTSMMLKSMNQTTNTLSDDKSNYFGSDIFDSILQTQMASYISEKQSLGIADLIYKKITGENMGSLKLQQPYDMKSRLNYLKSVGPIQEPAPKPTANNLEKYNDIISDASQTFGVDQSIIKAVIKAESNGNSKATSVASAKGLMQLIDSTAKDMGVKNVWDPKENIFGGTKYLSKLLKKFDGNLEKALAGYNAGPDAVEKYDGIPPYKETQKYVSKVINYIKQF